METTTTSLLSTNTQQAQQSPNDNDALRGLALDGFLELMVTELQNQDPLDPMDNSEILAQISQMREIEASSKMSDVLEAVATSIDGIALGQQIAGASSMIGKHVSATVASTTEEGEIEQINVQGIVDRVSFNGGEPTVHIDGFDIKMSEILTMSNADASEDSEEDADAETDEAAATDES